MTTRPDRAGHRARLCAVVVAVPVGLMVVVLGTPHPASATVGSETRVRASVENLAPLVGKLQRVSADQFRVSGVLEREIVVATGVPANGAVMSCSFAGSTLVLMAEGSKKPIEKVAKGDARLTLVSEPARNAAPALVVVVAVRVGPSSLSSGHRSRGRQSV